MDTPASAASVASAKRNRTRTGCYTCRRRKVCGACNCRAHHAEIMRQSTSHMRLMVSRPLIARCSFHSNRLGIPCVFPKLYLNTAGEWVPSPQPNGRGKRPCESFCRIPRSVASANNATESRPTQRDAAARDQPVVQRPTTAPVPAIGQASQHMPAESTSSMAELAPWAPVWDTDTIAITNMSEGSSSGELDYPHRQPPYIPSPPLDHALVSIDDILKELGFDASTPAFPGMDLTQTALPMDMDQMQAALGE